MDYSVLAEMGEIISHNDQAVVNDMRLLAQGYEAFYEKYPEWCDEIIDDPEDEEDYLIFLVFSSWLMGDKNNRKPYACHFDWREETEVMVKYLIKTLHACKLPLDLNEVHFSGHETTEEALAVINDYCRNHGYELISLGTNGDSYYVFITTYDNYERLRELGEHVEFDFYQGVV